MDFSKWVDIYRFDYQSLYEMMFRFALNSVTLIIIIRFLYYPITKRKNYLFAFFLNGTIIFLFCYMLASVQLQFGFVLGLFVVFRIIRFRTDSISIKDMTYLSIIIGISVINALFIDSKKIPELLFSNIVLIVIIFCVEHIWFTKNESTKTIMYEKTDLIKPENYHLLLEDLKNRTGLNILRLEIGKIDFLHDSIQIKIYFNESGDPHNVSDTDSKFKNNEDL